MNKSYYVNIERSALADTLNPRNVNISFLNNSLVPIDLLTFIWYSEGTMTIDIESGIVNRNADYA